MNCEDFNRFMADYLEGELPREAREIFEEHIRRCPPCVDFLDSYKTTKDLARLCECSNEQREAASEGLIRAILAARDGMPANEE